MNLTSSTLRQYHNVTLLHGILWTDILHAHYYLVAASDGNWTVAQVRARSKEVFRK